MNVDVLLGGPGRESAVSKVSGEAIANGLRRRGHDVAIVAVGARIDAAHLRPGAVAFNIVHGTYGEDGTLQAELDALRVAYVGSDAVASRLCMDKAATKARLAQHGIRTPWGASINLGTPFKPSDLKLPHHGPLVLKPACEGSSVGLKMVANPSFILPAIEELLPEIGAKPYLIEERLPGPEFTVPVLDEAAGPRALPPIRIRPAQGVYDYQAKYQRDDTGYELVEDQALAQQLGAIAVAAHLACGCRDLSRTDVMQTTDGGYAVLELNTLPGFTDHSLTPKSAAAAGISFDELVERLAARAAQRGINP
jgi:D-alanine-D-alanine ligase